MAVSQEDFDALVARVTALEASTERTAAMFGHLVMTNHQMMERFDDVEDRFDSVDRQLIEAERKSDDRFDVVDQHFGAIDQQLAEILRRL